MHFCETVREASASVVKRVKRSDGGDTSPNPAEEALLSKFDTLGHPIPFPHPKIGGCQIEKRGILISGVVRKANVLYCSETGHYYELGNMIKKAIYGQVVHAVLLAQVEASGTTKIKNSDTESPPLADDSKADINLQDDVSEPPFERTAEKVAIKVYLKTRLRDLQGRSNEDAMGEITALQYIGEQHPNLMGQIECCQDNVCIYSVMRFCNGGELFDYIDKNGAMEEAEAKVLFQQLITGLQALQQLGIGHRDISLENILYDASAPEGEQCIIIDYGMSVRLPWDPETKSFPPIKRLRPCGKKDYISPEVLRQDVEFNPMLCDVWAAGVVLFMILTGVPPVESATNADERYLMVAAGKLQEMVTAWELPVKPQAVELIQQILRPDPLQRLTLDEILTHPWLAHSAE